MTSGPEVARTELPPKVEEAKDALILQLLEWRDSHSDFGPDAPIPTPWMKVIYAINNLVREALVREEQLTKAVCDSKVTLAALERARDDALGSVWVNIEGFAYAAHRAQAIRSQFLLDRATDCERQINEAIDRLRYAEQAVTLERAKEAVRRDLGVAVKVGVLKSPDDFIDVALGAIRALVPEGRP